MKNLTLREKVKAAELLPRDEDKSIGPALRPHEILAVYKEIQHNIGILVNAAPKSTLRWNLIDLSVQLCRYKRQWIGSVDEIKGEL